MTSVLVLGIYAYVMCCVIKPGELQQKAVATLIAGFLLLTNYEGIANNANNSNQGNANRSNANRSNANNKKANRSNANRSNANRSNANNKKANNKNANKIIKTHQNGVANSMKGVVEASMGSESMPYADIVFSPDGCWMKQPDDAPLLSNDKLTSYLGSQGTVKMRYSDQNALAGPPIDGITGSPEKMFMFANNRASPECCPSTFSSSTGCVCTTKNQRDFVASRGRLVK